MFKKKYLASNVTFSDPSATFNQWNESDYLNVCYAYKIVFFILLHIHNKKWHSVKFIPIADKKKNDILFFSVLTSSGWLSPRLLGRWIFLLIRSLSRTKYHYFICVFIHIYGYCIQCISMFLLEYYSRFFFV